MMFKAIPIVFILFFISNSAVARFQNPRPESKPPITSEQSKAGETDQDIPNLPDEMRLRMKREREESDYKKAVESANQLFDTSVDLAKGYKEKSQLNDDSFKKISTLEKLARKILSHVGGDVVDTKDEKETVSVPDAIDQMIIAAESIKKHLAVDTRFVVSTTMISDSNQIIHLAQYLRRTSKHGN